MQITRTTNLTIKQQLKDNYTSLWHSGFEISPQIFRILKTAPNFSDLLISPLGNYIQALQESHASAGA